jgi:hypothetical protein
MNQETSLETGEPCIYSEELSYYMSDPRYKLQRSLQPPTG